MAAISSLYRIAPYDRSGQRLPDTYGCSSRPCCSCCYFCVGSAFIFISVPDISHSSICGAHDFYVGLSCRGVAWRDRRGRDGQREAGDALNLRYVVMLRRIIIPQAIKLGLAPTIGFLVQIIKGTSLACIIGFQDLMLVGKRWANAPVDGSEPFIIFPIMAVLYFVFVIHSCSRSAAGTNPGPRPVNSVEETSMGTVFNYPVGPFGYGPGQHLSSC